MLPWEKNTKGSSILDFSLVPSGYSILSGYHTHPNSSSASYSDAMLSQVHKITFYIIASDGNVYRVSDFHSGNPPPLIPSPMQPTNQIKYQPEYSYKIFQIK